jgi:hypothetical protein
MSTATIPGRNGQLMDLVNAALEDPEMDTDRRMRLQGEIREVLRKAHVDVHGHAGRAAHDKLALRHEQVEHMLHAVLTDPDLHTDLRMRLLQEIPRVTEAAYQRDTTR